MTTFDQFKLETIFNSDDTVSHVNDKDGLVSRTTWKQDKELGSGNFGEVWREKEIGGEVRAVKIMTKRILKRELEVLVRVNDYPELFVDFHGWYEDKHCIYLAMEYVPHGDLGEHMRANGVIDEPLAIVISRQILQGLVVLHGKGICHRNLKPQEILLTKLQNVLIVSLTPFQIKIADFGISAIQAGTYLQTLCGTRVYEAPEQLGLLPPGFTFHRGYIQSIDIWALGILLYQMMTSKHPFQTNNMSNVASDDSTLISEVDEGLTMDYTKLKNYCNGSSEFPKDCLQEVTSTNGIDFINCLLVANPKERMSAENARQNPWVVGLDGTLTGLARVLRSQFLVLGVRFPDGLLENCVEHGHNIYEMNKLCRPHLVPMRVTSRIEEGVFGSRNPEVYTILAVMGGVSLFKWGVFPLLALAAARGHLDAISLLVRNGANVNAPARGSCGRTALQAAAGGGHLDAISLLLNSGADVNAPACEYSGHLDAKFLLVSNGTNVNGPARGNYGRTALQAAAEGGHLDAISLLLNSGADVNAPACEYSGRTAVQAAAEGGHSNAISLLLNSGAVVNAPACQYGGRTALQAAAKGGHLDAISLLLTSGANVNAPARGSYGRTALQGAAEGGHLDAISLLLDTGADVNAPAREYGGRTALQAAAEGGFLDAISLLLRSGADAKALGSTTE
ncbi:hypothetical protein Q9L58_007827 [Maublancomyces gigas]|uniref:Protein kinase domain-containing protein n=1 Tax=Discina gigas TaxID=1032678 RepID=A0ABR3GBF5_9PEZI